MIVIGSLRHRVTFQEPVLTPDGAGGFSETWRDIADTPEVAGAVVALSAAERQAFGQLQSTVTHKIYIRMRDGLTPAMRAVKGDEVYEISALFDRDGGGTMLEILALQRL